VTFIPDDCFNIIMDVPPTGPSPWKPEWVSRGLAAGDLRRYADAGATVALEFAQWHLAEPAPGVYDWAVIDDEVGRCRAAGMRVLLMGPTTVPLWAPDEWYVWDSDGRPMRDHDKRNWLQTWGCFSPWNAEAMAYYAGFIRAMQARYQARYSRPNDVLVINSFSQEGEALLPPAIPCIYDPAALASYRDFMGNSRARPMFGSRSVAMWLMKTLPRAVTDLQLVYCCEPWREVWMALHPVYYGPAWGGSGVIDIPLAWRHVLREVQPRAAFHIAFDFFPRHRRDDEFGELLPALSEMGVGLVAGSDWPAGLRANTPAAVRLGMRALLTAPLHPYGMRTEPEPWVPDALRESAEVFRRGV
jgi:hypothetical protein